MNNQMITNFEKEFDFSEYSDFLLQKSIREFFGNILTVDNGVSLFKENITVGYKVTTVLDPLNTLEGVFTFKLSVFSFDLSSSVVYKQNGVWKSLEVF